MTDQWWCGMATTDGLGCIVRSGHEEDTEPKLHLSIAQLDDGVTLPVSDERAAEFPPIEGYSHDFDCAHWMPFPESHLLCTCWKSNL